jgi:glycine cleavage system H protein
LLDRLRAEFIHFPECWSALVSEIPSDLLYTEDHEYVKPTDDPAVVAIGITDYAQGELGDIVFIELPKVGASFNKHDVFGTVEAVKAVSELYSPVSGEVVAVNDRLDKEPALVNSSPYGDGWMVKVRLKDGGEKKALLNADAYGARLGH